MLTKYLGSSILAFSALANACSPSIAQERRISHLMIPDSLSDSPPAVLKIASSCRSKCRQKVKSCKRRCPKGSSMGGECRTNCGYAYQDCKKRC